MKRLTTVARYNRAKFGTHKLYCGVSKEGKTLTVLAWNQTEAREDMRKKGFRPVKIVKT